MKLDLNEIPKPVISGTIIGAVAFCGGLGIGYWLGKREQVTVYVEPEVKKGSVQAIKPEDIDEEEEFPLGKENYKTKAEVIIEEMGYGSLKDRVLMDKMDPSTIQVSQESLARRDELCLTLGDEIGMQVWHGIIPHPHEGEDKEEKEVIAVNVFAESKDDGWDYEKELKYRENNKIYVLHKDEFWAEESGFDQLTLTYYAADDILVDDRDDPIYNYEKTVGELKFGYGSGDPNVFHVRNENREAEYEILRDRGYYSMEVLGINLEEDEKKKTKTRAKTKLDLED